jgi:hypothetical protein
VVADAAGDVTVVDAAALLAEAGAGEPAADAAATGPRSARRSGGKPSAVESTSNRPRAARFGNVEVVPLADPASPATGERNGGTAPPAADATPDEVAAEADRAEASAEDRSATGGTEAEPAAAAGPAKPAPSGSRRSRRASPKKTEELFARLRGTAEERRSGAAGVDRNGGGAAAVIGGPVADPALGEGAAAAPAGSASSAADVTAGAEAEQAPGAPTAIDPEADAGPAREARDDTAHAEPAGEDTPGDDDAQEVDPDRVALHTRDAVLGAAVRDLSRQLKLALSDQQNELLEAGRTGKGRDSEADRPSLEDMARIYVSAAGGELAAAWSVGRRSIAPDDRTTGTVEDIAEQARLLGTAVVEALRQRLDTADSPADEPWPVERVRAAYREVRSQRLNELVEFHVFGAYAAGQLAAAPAGSQARWVCDTCGPDCLDNALASPLPFGEAFPTGHLAPPAFAGCRCVLVPEAGS